MASTGMAASTSDSTSDALSGEEVREYLRLIVPGYVYTY